MKYWPRSTVITGIFFPGAGAVPRCYPMPRNHFIFAHQLANYGLQPFLQLPVHPHLLVDLWKQKFTSMKQAFSILALDIVHGTVSDI